MVARPLGLSLYRWATWSAQPIAKWHMKRRVSKGKEDPSRVIERFGIASSPRPNGTLVWLHAVGVGEVLTIPAVIKAMLELNPDLSFLITSTARNAARALDANMPPKTVHQFVPLDAVPLIDRFLDHWSPDLSIWVEQEVFPNLIWQTQARNIPLALVNSRMGNQSFVSKFRFKRSFFTIYNFFSFIDAQDESTGENLRRLGVDPSKISITPTLKAGADSLSDWPEIREIWARKLVDKTPWCAASLHLEEANEILSAQVKILESDSKRTLILVPRNPNEGDAFVAKCKTMELSSHLLSSDSAVNAKIDVLIADTMGQLGVWYRMCDVAFIGGSLCDVEGHNPYEASNLSCAVLHGPRVANFAKSYADYHANSAAVEVRNSSDLSHAILEGHHSSSSEKASEIIAAGRQNVIETAERLLGLIK